jgi:hypothetical protein
VLAPLRRRSSLRAQGNGAFALAPDCLVDQLWNNGITSIVLVIGDRGRRTTAMAKLAHHLLDQRIEEVDQQIMSLKLRVGQQIIHLDDLVGHPQEAKKARATLDRWLGELSLLQHLRLDLYKQQIAFGGGLKAKAS